VSDTPRTDAKAFHNYFPGGLRNLSVVSADFARELERELAAAKAEVAKANAERDRARMLFLDNHPSVISGDMDAPRVAGMLGWDCFKKEAKP
jgi:hypothetical protein